tara:strand:+ start:169 stop:663 length:495 start_codon:yes stop_codon:yes gene_type:complete
MSAKYDEELFDNSEYEKELIKDIKRREKCLNLALKCQNESEKIYFIDNDFDRGQTGDFEDDTWWEMKYSFFEQYDLDEDNYEFVCENIESICWGKEITRKTIYDEEWNNLLRELKENFKKIFPDYEGEATLKQFKLNIFSLYFEENVYKYEIEFYKESIYGNKK